MNAHNHSIFRKRAFVAWDRLVYGLTHIIEGDFYHGNHAFEEASRFYDNEIVKAYFEDGHLDHAHSFEQLQEIRYNKALVVA